MPGHPAGNRVDGVANLCAARLQQVREVTNGVLGLSDRHAVARHDRHDASRFEEQGSLIGASALGPSRIDVALRAARGRFAQVAAQHVPQRAVHGLAHDLREDEAGRSD